MLDGGDTIRARTPDARGRAGELWADQLVKVRLSPRGAAVVVRASGEVDISCVASWGRHLHRAGELATPPGPVVVDLDGLTFLGACGLRALEDAWQICWGRGIVLRLATSNPLYTRMLATVDALRVLETFPTVPAALAAPTH